MAGQGPDDPLRVPQPGVPARRRPRWPFRGQVCAIGCIPSLPVRPYGQIRQHSRDGRQYPGGQGRQARARRHRPLRQDRGVQPTRLGQGPPRARRDRGRRAAGDPQAGPDRHRGHERQYGHRPRHGLRAEGVPARRHHGGVVQRGAAQADALPRRQGRPHAAPAGRDRDGEQGRRARQDARLVPDPAVRERGERRLPLADHGARDRQRLRRRAARLLGHRLRHRRHAQGRGPGARQGAAGDEDRARRARGRAAGVSSGTPQQRNPDGTPAARHPAWKPHPIQGWSPDFLPKLAGDAVEARQVSTG